MIHRPRLIDCTRCEGAGYILEQSVRCFVNDCAVETMCADCTDECRREHTIECKQCDGTGEEYEEAPNKWDEREKC